MITFFCIIYILIGIGATRKGGPALLQILTVLMWPQLLGEIIAILSEGTE